LTSVPGATNTPTSTTTATTACNDDAPGVTQSEVTFSATAGLSYSFMVSAYSGTGGTLMFDLVP
jgi:hypothetical protein